MDTNIILDVLLDREPFVEDAIQIFELIEPGNLQGFIAATTITNIFYILRKLIGREPTLLAIQKLLLSLEICAVDRQTIEWAIDANLKDFEDGVQAACASISELDAIVTRNGTDFVSISLPIFTAAALVAHRHVTLPIC
ncbi:MAG: PIN domain-containing protein [Cyanobacteria bacterium P01_H01_bin.58]